MFKIEKEFISDLKEAIDVLIDQGLPPREFKRLLRHGILRIVTDN